MVRICSVEGCEKKHYARGWCHVHYERWRAHGSVDVVLSAGKSGTSHNMWNENVSYNGAHQRVYRARGRASGHACECGNTAAHWAYDHLDKNQMTGENGGRVVTYSTDPAHYIAMCVTCHKAFDLSRIKESA